MSEKQFYKPTPGRDAMTNAGKRVKLVERKYTEGRSYLLDMLTGNHYSFEGECAYLGDTRQADPTDRQWRIDEGLDLVADWPDADPLPDADGWEPKVGDRVKLVKDGLSTVGAVGMEGVIKKIEAGQHPYLIELDEGLVYESHAVPEQYRLTRADHDYFVSAVRPAPSGPVVEETVKRIVPIGSDEWADQAERLEWAYIAGIMRELAGLARAPLPSYIQPAIDIAEARATEGWRTFRARQIGEAMEGK